MRKANYLLIIGVFLVVLTISQVSAQTVIYAYGGGMLSYIEGEGVMQTDGTISTPSRVMYGSRTADFMVHGARIEIAFASVNASSWGLYIHDREADTYRAIDENRTALSETYSLSGDVVGDGIAIAVVSGAVMLSNLTIYGSQASPKDFLDWLLYQIVPPWVIAVGALVCILIFIVLLIAPKGEKTKVGMYG